MHKLFLLFAGLTVFGLVFAQTASAATQTNRYVVKGNVNAAPPYDTEFKAAANIQDAINAAVAANGDQVLVAAATYDTGGTNVAGRYLTNRVYISKAITVRSINNDPTNTIIKGAWASTGQTNGWDAIRCVYMVDGASLVGFTLTNGATITTNEIDWSVIRSDACGGGVWAGGEWALYSSGSVSNCVIVGNAAFGNIYGNFGGGGGVMQATVFNSRIINNWCRQQGGGGACYAILSNCTVSGNSTTEGTGAGAYRGALYGCLVSSNTALRYGGGMAGYDATSRVRAYDCTIVNNWAGVDAGGAYRAVLSNCTVNFNQATNAAITGNGGGARDSTLINCQVISNRCDKTGGGAYGCTMTNCTLAYNVADAGGGAAQVSTLYDCLVYGNYARDAGGVYFSSLYNCTVVGNSASHVGGGIANYGGNMNVINSIVYSNQCATWPNWTEGYPSCFSFTNSCTFPTNVVWSAGNTTNYPLFMANGNGYGTNLVPGNYRLQASSPCVNRGLYQSWMDTAVDFDGRTRIDRFSGRVDMGCYEYLSKGTMFKVR